MEELLVVYEEYQRAKFTYDTEPNIENSIVLANIRKELGEAMDQYFLNLLSKLFKT